jgi:predicted nucleic acid-binding protein
MVTEMVLLDTDFIFSFFDQNQSTHDQAVEIVKTLSPDARFIMSNLVKQELATVISYKVDHSSMKQVMKLLEYFEADEIFISKHETDLIWEKFLQTKKKVSFIDVSNVFLAKKLSAKIASFDQFYPKSLRVS